MTQEAKKAAKLEKKLKILLGGYQVKFFSAGYELCIFVSYFAFFLIG